MLKSYLKIALRNLLRRKGYTFINVAGLALGMACAILIFLSVRHDLSFDRFHADADRIFRVLTIDRALGVTSQEVGISMPAIAPAMAAEFPEVEKAVRVQNGGQTLLSFEDKDLNAEDLLYAEPGFFDLFDFRLLSGESAQVLKEPNSIVLTRSMAERLFGDAEKAVGQTIQVSNPGVQADMRVTGITEDAPSNSHIQFDALVAMVPSADQEQFRQYLNSWDNISMGAYVLLRDPSPGAVEDLKQKMEALIRRNDVEKNFSVTLQPMTDVHLKSSGILFDASARKSDIGYVYGLSAVGLFVLAIAVFNFMNLATARSAERAREVGVRKVVGAGRKQLIMQHLGESFVLCGLAFLLAVTLASVAVPFVNATFGKNLSLNVIEDPVLILYLLGLAVVIALLSGSYPAFVLSSLQPVSVLKGSFKTGASGRTLRKALVVTQFTAAAVMIVGALIVSRQLDYIMGANLGYDREQVVVLDVGGPRQANAEALEDELLRHQAIRSIGLSNSVPGQGTGRTGLEPEGATADDNWIMSIMVVDDQFFETLGIQMAEGRAYSPQFPADSTQSILLNEAAAKALGWQQPLGKRITLGQQERQVVGVVKDFHFASVRHRIEPMIFLPVQSGAPTMSVKIAGADVPSALAHIESTWKRLYPDYPFEYTFLDEEFADQYREESNFAAFSQGLTVFSILIACLGLFGLAAFSAEQRTKEIGVRKVMGASVSSIVVLLSKEFLLLVLMAFVIAAPLAWYVMDRWLSEFAYRVPIDAATFLLTAILAVTIALGTVSYQAFRAAMTDPVKSLRYE